MRARHSLQSIGKQKATDRQKKKTVLARLTRDSTAKLWRRIYTLVFKEKSEPPPPSRNRNDAKRRGWKLSCCYGFPKGSSFYRRDFQETMSHQASFFLFPYLPTTLPVVGRKLFVLLLYYAIVDGQDNNPTFVECRRKESLFLSLFLFIFIFLFVFNKSTDWIKWTMSKGSPVAYLLRYKI